MVKKGRHRRFEEARALKRSPNTDLDELLDSLTDGEDTEPKPEHEAWADMYDEPADEPWADPAAEYSAAEAEPPAESA